MTDESGRSWVNFAEYGSNSDVAVRFRDGSGEFVDTALRRVQLDEVLSGLPVREFRWWKGKRHYSGWYWSSTTGGHVVYESRLELARILLADQDRDVVGIAAQPFVLQGTDGDRVRRRFALERLDRPQRTWPRSASPHAWSHKKRAEQMLTREFSEREHLQAGHTLRKISSTTGFSTIDLSRAARRHGITIRKGQAPAPIDAAWLRNQYLDRGRNMVEIAEELGTIPSVIANALHRFAIPVRPSIGVHAWRETNQTHPDLPDTIRAAVENTYNGWQRLRRFEIAMRFPNLKPAAAYLEIGQAVLAGQLDTPERTTGGPLFIRHTRPQPQKPTPLGRTLLDHLATELVHTRMIATLGDHGCPPMPNAAALAHHQRLDELSVLPISLDRGRLDLLRVLADYGPGAEFCGIEISKAAAASSTTINRLLTQMTTANWLTRRPEPTSSGSNARARRRVYFRFTPDGHRAIVRILRLPPESDKSMKPNRRQNSEKTHGSRKP